MKLGNLICFLSCIVATDGNNNAILEDIIRSIERALAFYERNKNFITLDDVFALRLLEGQILIANNQLQRNTVPVSNDLPSNIPSHLTTIYQHARNLSTTALNSLYKDSQWSSAAKSYVYQRPWSFAASYRQLDPSLKWQANMYKSTKEYSKREALCFLELMRSGLQHACNITGDCIKIMFTRGQNLHPVLQQLLYTLIAEQMGCLSDLNLRMISSESVQKWQAELCTNIFFTVSDSILKNGNIVPPHLEGAVLKTALLCPFAGYTEFFHFDWLRKILSWQTVLGCWGSAQHSTRSLVTRMQVTDKAVHKKNEEARDRLYALKAQAKGAFRDFRMKNEGMKNMQGFDFGSPVRTERFRRLRMKRGLTDTKRSRTVGAEEFGHQVAMSTVVARRRMLKNPQTVGTKDQLGFLNESLLLTDTSGHVRSSVSLPGGCVTPLTAAAIGALSQYLRFCLVAPLSKISPFNYLVGTNYILNPDKLANYAGKAGLPVTTFKTRKRSNDTATNGFGDRGLNHSLDNFAKESSKHEIENKVNTAHMLEDPDLRKVAIKADPNAVEVALDGGDRNDEDGGLVLGVQEEEDVTDYSFPPDDAVNLEDGSRDFGGKGTKDQGIQNGGYDSYYDDTDEDNGRDQPLPWHFDHDLSDKLAKSTHSSSQVISAVDSSFNAVVAVGRTYSVLLGVMILFIWLLYRILRKRKTGLIYRYSRWK